MKNTTLKEILINYERKRDNAERDLEKRKEDVYRQIPEIKEIEDKINKIGIDMVKLVLKNPSSKDEICLHSKNEINKLHEQKKKLLNLAKVPKWYLDIQYECDVCKDRGFLHNGKKCNCLKQALINETYKMSNLSRILEKQNQSTYDDSIFSDVIDPKVGISPRQNMQSILLKCEDFIGNFEKDNDNNLLFYGNPGSGKTFMSSYIAKEILDKGYVVIYQTAFKMFEIIEQYKFTNSDKTLNGSDYENLFDCDLLIIDDLGTELTNSFTDGELFNILNSRLLSGKKTIICTCLDLIEIRNKYSHMIFSRLVGTYKFTKFIGNDLRFMV